ncbi:PilZ domain-containing protein [Oryzomicrobium sp.]|uniref:PilZ domain-containing protein n=2 Tax=Oryzomicrobium sp. TaxID=1911578 RepID=UPI002FE0EF0A
MIEHRMHRRFPVRWPVAIVFDHAAERATYRGLTWDLSLGGAAILSEHNLFVPGAVTLLISVPPLYPGQRQPLIEVRANMAYTVLSNTHDCFRLGIRFDQFKDNGEQRLLDNLQARYEIIV